LLQSVKNNIKASRQNKAAKHHPLLIKLLSDELDCEPDAIVDFELCLADTQVGSSFHSG
jgi:aspartyl aminopeptidase